MISPQSEVLTRHLPLFLNKSVLLAGAMQDSFADMLQKKCTQLQVYSFYFDYVRQIPYAQFAGECPSNADLIVYYWGKNKAEVQYQLWELLAEAPLGQEMLLIGENRGGIRSAEKLLAPFGDIAKIDSARRCSLYHFSLAKNPTFNAADFWRQYPIKDLKIYSLPGVFSAAALDQGTDLLLQTLDQPLSGDILDLGCGAGVIGAYVASKNPQARLLLCDIHALALASAQRTLIENKLQGEVRPSDVFSDIREKFDVILSNPPFHDGLDTAYRAVEELISQAKFHLKKGGELRIVANHHLPYSDILAKYFGRFEVIAQNKQFKVYQVFN